MSARSLVALVLTLLPAGLAASAGIEDLPGEVVVAVELSAPAERLETLTGTPVWDDLRGLLQTLGRVGHGHTAPSRLAPLVATWPEDAVLRDHLRALAGRRMLLAAFATGGPDPLGWVLAMEGEGGAESALALVGLAQVVGLEARPAAQGWTALTGGGRGPIALGRQAGAWLLLGSPGSAPEVERLARALAGDGGWPRLGEAPDFRDAMTRVPEDAHVRGFVRPSSLLPLVASAAADERRLMPLRLLLADCDALAFGRSLGFDRLEAWAAARVPAEAEGPVARLARLLSPPDPPLSGLLPDEALLAWDLGVAPRTLVEVVAGILRQAAPGLLERAAGVLSDLRGATGVDPEREVLWRLRAGVAVGLLPPDPDDRWRRPRTVLVAAVEDGPPVMAPLTACARWLAGAVAHLTEGLASATVIREEVSGVETATLAVEGVVPLHLPSPTAGEVDGLLVLSPTSSAVRDPVGAIARRRRPAGAPPRDGAVVERLRADAGGLARLAAGVIRTAGAAPPRGEHAARAERLAEDLERLAGRLGELRAVARLEGRGGAAWILGHAELELE